MKTLDCNQDAKAALPPATGSACRDMLPAVMKCEGCGRFTRTEDLTPDYDLMLLCERCLGKLQDAPNEKLTDSRP